MHPFILGKAHDPDFQPQADHPVTNFQKVGFPQFMGREFFEDLMVFVLGNMLEAMIRKNGWEKEMEKTAEGCCELQFCVASGCTEKGEQASRDEFR